MDGETWDKAFEESLKGMSNEEMIYEIIECSPSLTQLEMEIVSEELGKRPESDSLEELDDMYDKR